MPRQRKAWVWTAAIACCAAISYLAIDMLIGDKLRNRPAKPAISRMMSDLAPGDSREHARSVVESHMVPRLRFDRLTESTWQVGMPLEFGAKDWILRIDFVGDEVSRLRIRTSDSIDVKPVDAPDDQP